jgi:hypothetical protein
VARNRQSQQTITVDVGLRSRKGEETPAARAYLFDRAGALVDSKPVGGKLTFELADDGTHRVVIGPDVPVGDRAHADLAAELERAGAVSRDVGPAVGTSVSLRIPPSVYRCWWQTCIFVHGSVRKETSPGVYAPICTGVVQIFQVDLGCTLDRLASFTDAPLWYALVADVLEGGLERAAIVDRIRQVPNLPDPPPEAFHETHVVQPSLVTGRLTAAASVSGGVPLPPVPGTGSLADASADSAAVAPAPIAATALELSAILRSLPAASVNDALVANKAILAPYLCWLIPDWWFCWQELGEATIQSDGTFSAEICFWCPEDFPDLYFEVVQTVNGIEREISDPQIACSTYYDYDGSRDVVITVTDPTAVACNGPGHRPIPGTGYYVWPQSIGNADLRGIAGLESAPGGPPQGLLGTRPWGGTLALKMEFDPRLKPDGVAKYYRWSYRFDGDPDWSPINAPVTHRYQTITYSPLHIHLHSVNLGPKPPIGGQANLFEIPDPYPGDGWVSISDPWDVPFAYFDSTDNHYAPFTYTDTLPRRGGMCTLLLELFDASGSLVPCGNDGVGGPFVFVLPDLGGSPSDYTSVLGANNITPSGQLVFRVLVDNADTYAKVDTITAAGAHADSCGILHYSSSSDPVAIGFHATHPDDYLTWLLRVYRGASGVVAQTPTGSSSSPPQAPNPFTNLASALLGGCTNAAFAADLWTWATATDGYGRQSQYDNFDSHPFALIYP